MLRNLACSLILSERDASYYEGLFQSDGKTPVQPPKYKGRVVTTLHKAKEVRPLVEKCVTIAKKGLVHQEAAEKFATDEDRNSAAWKKWRESDSWQKWNAAIAPAISARRRVFSILRDKEAVEILFDEVAPRFADRPGGYTRVLRLAKPRLGDAGLRGMIEFVGVHDRVKIKSEKPVFEAETDAPQPAALKPQGKVEEESSAPAEEAAASEAAPTDEAGDE